MSVFLIGFYALQRDKRYPHCVHREDDIFDLSMGIFHCNLHKDVVNCCGRKISGCIDYQLSKIN